MTRRAEKRVLDGLSFDVPAHERMDLVEELGYVNGTARREFSEGVLVRVLKEDPNPIVRHEAAFSLGRLHHDEAPLSIKTTKALCDAALSDESGVVRHEATEILGCLSAPKVRESLERVLADLDEDVVETARISLARLLADE